MDRLEELNYKKQLAQKGGGEKRIEKEYSKGKLTARDRIKLLVDDDTFEELDMLKELVSALLAVSLSS